MDFGRSVKKRAKLMDKKLDEIVPNPYEGQVKHNYNKVKKPLFIAFGTAAACACIAFGSIGVIEILKHHNAHKGNVIINPNPNPQPKPDPDKPQPYTGKTPTINIKDYVSANFGFPEFSYFSFFANNLTQTKMMAPYGDIIDNEEKEYTTMSPMESYYDDEGRIHEPLPICETYSFSDFLYFEFETTNDSFLEGNIGNGRIQALSVHTSVYDEDVLILKNENRFFSCLGHGKNTDANGKLTELVFSANKYIEDWDIVRDLNDEKPISIYFKSGKEYEGAAVMEINGESYDINSDTVFFLKYSFSISVNQVRKYIGLDPDPRFDGTQIDLSPKEINFNTTESFVLEEFGSTPFKRGFMLGDGTFDYRYGDKTIFFDHYNSWRDDNITFFAADITNDGYRDFVYLGKTGLVYNVVVYDFHNDTFLIEDVTYNRNVIWFKINNNSLIAYQSNGYVDSDLEFVYDYADIVYDSTNNSICLSWWNIYQVDVFDLVRIDSQDGSSIHIDSDRTYSILSDRTYYFVFAIKRYTRYPDIATFTPEKAGITWTEKENQTVYLSKPYEETSTNYYSLGLRFPSGIYEIWFNLSSLKTNHIKIYAE